MLIGIRTVPNIAMPDLRCGATLDGGQMRRHNAAAVFVALGIAVLALASVEACAAPGINYWNIDKLLALDAQELELTDGLGSTFGTLVRERVLVLNEVRRRLEKSAGIPADLYLAASDQPYFFSSRIATGRNLICKIGRAHV